MNIAFYLSGNPVHDNVILAMYHGCPENRQLIQGFKFQDADVAVVFGINKSRVPVSWPRGRIIERQKSIGGRVLVLETGYIHRGDGDHHYYAAGFDHINGRADFRNEGMPSDRSADLEVDLKPQRHGGENIVLCGQVPQDASVDHINIEEWLDHAVDEIKARTERNIVFRPHPLARTPAIEGCDYSSKPLASDLSKAHCCVTFNSNSAVEAVIAGIPSFAFDVGSMALKVCNTDWDAIENPILPDRTQWLRDLAYAQWTPDEMRKGLAWSHLFR